MKFKLIAPRTSRPKSVTQVPTAILVWNDWDDYGYRTSFDLYLYLEPNKPAEAIGRVKIMQFGQKPKQRTFPTQTAEFGIIDDLPEEYCSLGWDLDFYNNLKAVPQNIALQVLVGLKDASYNRYIEARFSDQQCFQVSLLRDSGAVEALEMGGQMFGGVARNAEKFLVEINMEGASSPHKIDFDFSENGGLPRRINVIVGLNGVGKTQFMSKLAVLLSRFAERDEKLQEGDSSYEGSALESAGSIKPRPSVFAVVAVSFSAFDNFELPTVKDMRKFRYSYCGLRRKRSGFLSEEQIAERVISLVEELSPHNQGLMKEALVRLIKTKDIESFVEDPSAHSEIYHQFSAGQKIALNIISHILHNIGPRTLILFDEPEIHLHPQLMTTLMSVLTDILERYNSYAVVATHSPIVVQQVPSRCVHIMQRHGTLPITISPPTECFGENLSELSRSVFLASEGDRDYEDVLDRLLEESNYDPTAVEELFDRGLSMNARIYLNSRANAQR